MRLLFLTALVAAVASSPLAETQKWPWQVGKDYVYDVKSLTWTQYDQSDSNGSAFSAKFIIRVKAPGRLQAKLENLAYANVQGRINLFDDYPALAYQAVKSDNDHPFEIFVDGGRVLSLKVPSDFTVGYENLLKGLVSALQVDLSPYGSTDDYPNTFDKDSFQGLFKKSEADVTGDCDTLYSVAPVSAEWRRELPKFVTEDPIEIVKSRNYDVCKTRVAYYTGVPEGTVWNGIANGVEKKQFIQHTSESRVIVGKQGTIYKVDTLSSVFVNPLIFGAQKAEVFSSVTAELASEPQDSSAEWEVQDDVRTIDSLLYTLTEATYSPVNVDNIVNAQKLLQEITPMLQNPSNLPKADFLSKFNVLVRVISSMNAKQLAQMTISAEIAKSSKNSAKTNMWVVYRDAVAQAGTVAAYEEIKAWILTKKIQGEEAAQVIASVPNVLRYPSKEVLKDFFEFAFNAEVVEQRFLNTSALLAATKFYRYGDESQFVVETVIPRLSQELKKAVEEGDSHKAQVYINVLSNVANSNILNVFAPYLDGTVPVSKYLRTQIVTSLKTLANLKNEKVTAVLFSILKNTAELYEVRVAAALNIFLAKPSFEMVKIMAYMTNTDPSTQVRAVLTTGLKFVSGLKNSQFKDLATNAKAVLHLVSKENFGFRYSTDSIIDEYSSSDESGHFRELSYIGSENNILPLYERFALRLRGNGLTEEDWLTLSISDVQSFIDYIVKELGEHHKTDVNFKFSAEKLSELLNIKPKASSPLEGSLFIDELDQQRLFTLGEEEFKAFAASLIKYVEQVMTSDGADTQFTKVVTNKPVFVTFPLAAGMPFLFSYSEPIAFVIQSKTSVKVLADSSRSLVTDFQFTYARNLEGSVGFYDSFSETYTSTGVINKFQLYFPIKLNVNFKLFDVKLSFELPETDVNFVHLSVWPYTSSQETPIVLAVLDDQSTKLIERPAKVLTTDINVTKQTGVAYRFKGYTYSSDYKNPSKLFVGNVLSDVRTFLYQKDVALTQFDLKYVAAESDNKVVSFTVFLDTLYNQKQSGELGPAATIEDVSPNSAARRELLAKRVASGIDAAKVQLLDLSVVFEGKQKVEYVFTGAVANSYIDNKVQGAVFLRGSEQINVVFKMIKPQIVALNFEEALKNEIKPIYEADIKFGNEKNIQAKSFAERSEEYTRQLKNDPLAEQCLQETRNGNSFQTDCYNLIMKAHAPDFFRTTVSYGELKPVYWNYLKNLVQFLETRYSWAITESNPLKKTDAGKLDIVTKFFYYDNYLNFEFTSQYGTFSLKNVEGLWHFPYAMAIYAPITSYERSRNWYTGYQHIPVCVVDGSKVSTFSGRNYDYSLTGSWHAVMVGGTNDLAWWTDLVVLARRPSDKQEEVYISYNGKSSNYLELEINPTAVSVKSNAKKVSEGNYTLYWDEDAEAPLLEYYTLADGVKIFSINNAALRIVYDGQRLVIFTDAYRSTVNGICGQSSSQTNDDFLTPWGLVDEPQYYGASFSLDGEFSDAKTAELKKEAKLKAYQPVTKYTKVLPYDAEWSKVKNQSFKSQ